MKLDLLTILPPTHPDKDQNAWQRSVSFAVILLSGSLIASTGMLGAALYQEREQHAATTEKFVNFLDSMTSRLNQAEAETIAIRLLMIRTRYCLALKDGRTADAADWNQQIVDLKAKYQGLTKGIGFPAFEPCP